MLRLIKIAALGIAVYFGMQAYRSYHEQSQSKPIVTPAADGLFRSIAPTGPVFEENPSSLFPDHKPKPLGEGKLLKKISAKRPRPLRRLLGKDQ